MGGNARTFRRGVAFAFSQHDVTQTALSGHHLGFVVLLIFGNQGGYLFLLLFHARFEGDFFCVFLIFHDFCKMGFITLECLGLIAHTQDGELDELVALGDGVDHVLV